VICPLGTVNVPHHFDFESVLVAIGLQPSTGRRIDVYLLDTGIELARDAP
jgi:hypothetical protein